MGRALLPPSHPSRVSTKPATGLGGHGAARRRYPSRPSRRERLPLWRAYRPRAWEPLDGAGSPLAASVAPCGAQTGGSPWTGHRGMCLDGTGWQHSVVLPSSHDSLGPSYMAPYIWAIVVAFQDVRRVHGPVHLAPILQAFVRRSTSERAVPAGCQRQRLAV